MELVVEPGVGGGVGDGVGGGECVEVLGGGEWVGEVWGFWGRGRGRGRWRRILVRRAMVVGVLVVEKS